MLISERKEFGVRLVCMEKHISLGTYVYSKSRWITDLVSVSILIIGGRMLSQEEEIVTPSYSYRYEIKVQVDVSNTQKDWC